MRTAFELLQTAVVLFVALHDWIPLGPLSDPAGIRAADTRGRLLAVTLISTLPFAVGLAASLRHPTGLYPGWLLIELWTTYALALGGILRAWWLPYAFGTDAGHRERHRVRFARTHAFLPERNGIRPDTLHVGFHAVFAATFLMLAVLSFGGGPASIVAVP